MATAHHRAILEVKGGWCGIAWHAAAITRFHLPGDSWDETRRAIARRAPDARDATPEGIGAEAAALAVRYFNGERVDFASLAVDLSGQSDFALRIYAATRRLGWGETTTYGALAQEIGGGWEMARAVGQAMGKNPVPLIIPCHRVLAAGGKSGGFSAPGGSRAKLRMLEMEGAGPLGSAQMRLDL
ncbi:methylated-DNA--[protein]-cysteine S-methyltransferase [Xanthobacteraceae bacterium A53D]